MAQNDVRDAVIGIVAVTVFTAIVVWIYDIPASPTRAIVFIGALSALGIVARSTVDYTVGFILFSLALIALVVEFIIPSRIVRPFQGIAAAINGMLGFDIFSYINALDFAILTFAFVTGLMMVRIWITPGDRQFLDTVVDKIFRQYAVWFDRYVSVGRLFLLLFIGFIVIIMEQAALLTGTIGDIMAQAPVVVSNIFAFLAGFLSLGGELPFIGTIPLLNSLTATEYAMIVGAVLFLAVATHWGGSGPLAGYLKR